MAMISLKDAYFMNSIKNNLDKSKGNNNGINSKTMAKLLAMVEKK